MAQLQGTGDFFAHGQDAAVGIDLDPKDPQYAAHQDADRPDQRENTVTITWIGPATPAAAFSALVMA